MLLKKPLLTDRIINAVFFIVLPFFLTIMAFVLATQLRTSQNVERISRDNKELLSKVQDLSRDNKKLNEENKKLAEENKAYSFCIAKTFAKFTQDQQPIIIETPDELEACTLGVVQGVEPIQSKSTSTPQPQPTPVVVPSPSNQPQPTPTTPPATVLEQFVDAVNETVEQLTDVLGLD